MNMLDIREDIAAFADDEQGVIVEKNQILFSRDRRPYICTCTEVEGQLTIEFEGKKLPYRKFIAEELGRMSILAEAIKQKTPDITPYINTLGILESAEGPGLELLQLKCSEKPLGQTQVVFLTADAGEGKSALLRRLTRQTAQLYTEGNASWLMLHVDIQGRQLLRLEEAIAGVLGRLRISGLFYSGVIALARHNLLVLAIDGFDELLAETGSGEAFSALGAVLKQLHGNGIVVAASRTAFFEAENYIAQSNLLMRLHDSPCAFENLRLKKWHRPETIQFFQECIVEGKKIRQPEETYNHLASQLTEQHPALTRPFLVDRIARTLIGTEDQAQGLITQITSQDRVVPNVIRAFLKREVEEKWHDLNGIPYLTLDQHIRFLSMVADEMWVQGDDSLPLDLVQLTAQLLVDEVGISEGRKPKVVEMAKAHVLLTNSAAGRPNHRAFDHEEFLNYFLARHLLALLSGDQPTLQRFLERHVLPKTTCRWIALDREWTSDEIVQLFKLLGNLAAAQVRSTALKQNCGAICAELIALPTAPENLEADSLYFEGVQWIKSNIRRAKFHKCTFVDVTWTGTNLANCEFASCTLTNLNVDEGTDLSGSTFDPQCSVTGIKILEEQFESLRDYVEPRCRRILEKLGASFQSEALPPKSNQSAPEPSHLQRRRKCLAAFIRLFERNSGVTEQLIMTRLGSRSATFSSEVLPILIDLGIVQETSYRGHGVQKRFVLNTSVDALLRAEDPNSAESSTLKEFWKRLTKK